MDVQTSHLAAALLAGSGMYRNHTDLAQNADSVKLEKEEVSDANRHDRHEEDKETEACSNDEYTDEESENTTGNKASAPGRTVTLQMLLDAKVLEPGDAAMTIEYLGQKFVGDLLPDGKIRSHETETIFCSPSAWAIHCKRIINPDKRSGCGWASVRYKGKKLDTIKNTYICKVQQQRELMPTDDECEMEAVSTPEPPPQRIVVKHNTVPNRMIQHDANTLVEAVSFSSIGKVQPFLVSISTNACLVLDLHCHLTMSEVCGYLGGTWDVNNHNAGIGGYGQIEHSDTAKYHLAKQGAIPAWKSDIAVTHAFPCLTSKLDPKPAVLVEAEILMQMEQLGLSPVGWYHSHPTSPAMPSLRDCDSQLDYQIRTRGPTEVTYTPCIGIICSPYNPESPALESSLSCFWVSPPPEQRAGEYPRPLLMQYTVVHDAHLHTHARHQVKQSIRYYSALADDNTIKFLDSYKPDITYLDKLKSTLTPKFPREQSDGLLWHFIRDALGCLFDDDDKIDDLDALLAVPQQIPISKAPQQPVIPNVPSVSTLQQMVSRPPGIPPMSTSSSTLGSLSAMQKFELSRMKSTHLNIPTPLTSKSKSSLSSSPINFDALASMSMNLGGVLDGLTSNNLLAGLPAGISTSLAATLTGTKLPDPPSYAASLHNLSTNSYDKNTATSMSMSQPVSSSSPNMSGNIPASLASNLMMSSADIANAIFSSSKYPSTGSLLGIPDPMSKSTLAANNMFLSPSLLKMQESLLKPLSSSSPLSSKSGLDQNLLMKSPQDILKSAKEYLPPDFNLSSLKGKLDFALSPETSIKHTDLGLPEGTNDIPTDFSINTSKSTESFLSQMLELTNKTTKSDYLNDYSNKVSKSDDYPAPLSSSPGALNFSTHSSIADTIAQVAMGALPAPSVLPPPQLPSEDVADYSMEQDLSVHKEPSDDDLRN